MDIEHQNFIDVNIDRSFIDFSIIIEFEDNKIVEMMNFELFWKVNANE